MRRSTIAGSGSYLPERVITNDELADRVDTSDDWIVQRTGIRLRHVAGPGESTSHLAIEAARRALDMAGVAGSDVDLVVVGTATPDETFPSVATMVQSGIGMERGAGFDVQAACSGFVYALSVADTMIRTGQVGCALVIGAETMSRLLDWSDRSTCVLFGDGAGAVVLQASEGTGGPEDRGILSTHLHSDGRLHDILFTDGGASTTQTAGHVRMHGREVFRHAVANLADVVDEALAANGLPADAIDWLVPHQANRRIIDAMARKLGLSTERVVLTIDRHANTSSASIPVALDEAVRDGRIVPGHLVLMEAMGGGLTWGSALVRM